MLLLPAKFKQSFIYINKSLDERSIILWIDWQFIDLMLSVIGQFAKEHLPRDCRSQHFDIKCLTIYCCDYHSVTDNRDKF